jgi:hypothetical protein
VHEQRERVYHKGFVRVLGGRRLPEKEPDGPPGEGGVGASCLGEGVGGG